MAAITWKEAKAETFKAAKDAKKMLVLYFEDTTKTEEMLKGLDIGDLVSKGTVEPIKVTKSVADAATEQAKDKAAIAPVSKLDATDLWKAYGVTKAGTFVVADLYGNEYYRSTELKLADEVNKVTKTAKELRKKLDDLVDKAEKAAEKDDTATAVKNLLSVFKENKVGFKAVDKAVELYNKLIAKGRERLKTAAGDEKTLNGMKDAYKGTDLASEIDEALKGAVPGADGDKPAAAKFGERGEVYPIPAPNGDKPAAAK